MNPHPLAAMFPLMTGPAFEDLRADIGKHGLREPIVTYEGKVLDGRNRLRACIETDTPPVFREWDGSDPLAFVLSANLHRRHLDESQRAMVAATLANLKNGQRADQAASIEAACTQDRAAELLNVSRSALQRAQRVNAQGITELAQKVQAGELSVSAAADIASLRQDEQRRLIDADDPIAVLQASKAIRARKAIENQRTKQELQTRILALPPPDGMYRTIVVDPPWPMQKIERDLRPDQVGFDYPTMTLAAIEDLDIPAAEDCHLYLWTTQKFLFDAGEILKRWGFRYHFAMVWKKPGGPKPYNWPLLNCEFVLFGRKGTFDFLDTKAFCTCFEAPRRQHSRKPDEFYDTVRGVSPGPRLDMFSREPREGFDQYGIEHDKFDGSAASS